MIEQSATISIEEVVLHSPQTGDDGIAIKSLSDIKIFHIRPQKVGTA